MEIKVSRFIIICNKIMQSLARRLVFYQRLSRLLQTQQNARFLQQLNHYQLPYDQKPSTSVDHFLNGRSLGLSIDKDRGDLAKIFLDTQPLLFHSQQTVIERISEFIIQIDKLEKELQIEKRILFGLRKKMDKLKLSQMPSRPHTKQIQTMQQSEQIVALQQEIAETQQRIHLIRLLDNDIDGKLEDLRKRNRELDMELSEVRERIDQNRRLVELRGNLSKETAQMTYNKDQEEDVLEQLLKMGEIQQICEVICDVLKTRLTLQLQVMEEQTQKQNFTEILGKFQVKYKEVKQKNTALKHRIEEGKRSAIFQLLQF